MAFSGPLEDRIEINELNASYADLISSGELEEWNALWAEEAVWEHPKAGRLVGLKEIAATAVQSLNFITFLQFTCQLGRLTVDGDKASGRVWVTEYITRKDGGSSRLCAVYDDEYVKRDGRWLFLRRSYTYRHRVVETAADL